MEVNLDVIPNGFYYLDTPDGLETIEKVEWPKNTAFRVIPSGRVERIVLAVPLSGTSLRDYRSGVVVGRQYIAAFARYEKYQGEYEGPMKMLTRLSPYGLDKYRAFFARETGRCAFCATARDMSDIYLEQGYHDKCGVDETGSIELAQYTY